MARDLFAPAQTIQKKEPRDLFAGVQTQPEQSTASIIAEDILTPAIASRLLGLPEGQTPGRALAEKIRIPESVIPYKAKIPKVSEDAYQWASKNLPDVGIPYVTPTIREMGQGAALVPRLMNPRFAADFSTGVVGDIVDMAATPLTYLIPPAMKYGGRAIGAGARCSVPHRRR